ncbi:hypothetical protein GCM10023189_30960 [Nibrella saemangeumensis]|uniref:4-amino-4-deoxy-L-arabinose transferase n=1 Tax=Nibrella saemangeumensis TaxID=1084526 RepID=A0ABP8N2G5_9BACT
MKHPLVSLSVQIVAALLFLLAFVPLLVLSFHNHPSAADDYCFADTAVRFGFWQAQKFYYDGWTGRYFSNFLVHGNPLVWGWYSGFRLIPVLAAAGLFLAMYSLLSELLRGRSLKTQLLTTGALFFLLILAMQSMVEAFFWTAAVASYTVPTAFTLHLLAVMSRWYRLRAGLLRTLTTIWAGFLVFAIVGSSETSLVLLVLLLLSVFGYRLLFLRIADRFLGFLVFMALVSAWLLFRAPGNAIRMGGNEHSGEFIASFVSSFIWLGKSVLKWLVQTPVLPLSVMFIPLAMRLVRMDSPSRPLFHLPPLIVTVLYIGFLAAMIFPSYYGIGIPPAYRVMNVVYLFFLLGWFYVLTVWMVQAVRRGWLRTDTFRLPVWVPLLAGIWVVVSIGFSIPLKTMYTDWLNGDAAIYDRDMTERYRQLTQGSNDTLRLVPIRVYPPSLFVEDIKDNPEHLWNRCQAGYYGHKMIQLETVTTAGRQPVSQLATHP